MRRLSPIALAIGGRRACQNTADCPYVFPVAPEMSLQFEPFLSLLPADRRLRGVLRCGCDSTKANSDATPVITLAVPSNRVSAANEVTTDGSGWASVTFNPLRGMPLKRGAQLTFFVRARKAGENPLAGVSSRRLVSVRISP